MSFHPSVSGGVPVEWPQTARLAGAAGFQAVDVALQNIAHETASAVLATLADAGVAAGAVPLPVEFRRDEATFARDFARLGILADLAAKIGVKTMYRSVPASSTMPRSQLTPILRRRLVACAEILLERGIALAIEAIGPLHRRREGSHEFIWRLPDAAAFADSCGPGVGLVVDSWHWHHSRGTARDIIDLGERILHVHVADAPDVAVDAIRDDERLLPGTGVIDFGGFFRALVSTGYSGLISPEVPGYRCTAADRVDCARRALAATLSVIAPVGFAHPRDDAGPALSGPRQPAGPIAALARR
jgi:sugar phosphate isomerase/epimerase